MPTLQDIKKRITSIKSTQKITRAMKMVSAAKLRRAQQSLNNHRPFANKLDELVGLILMLSDERQTPALMIPHDQQHSLDLLVYTSNRGLCGGFNANLMRHTESVLKQLKHDQKKTTLQIIGRKGRAFLTARKIPIDHYWPDYADTLTFSQASVLATEAINRFTQHESDSFSLVYNQFESAASHKIVTKQILPIALSSREDTPDLARQYCFDFIYEPDRISFLHQLLHQYIATQIYRAHLESAASELGARMVAMESATNNAVDMVGYLTLQYNRARQSAITKELMDIVNGAEALK